MTFGEDKKRDRLTSFNQHHHPRKFIPIPISLHCGGAHLKWCVGTKSTSINGPFLPARRVKITREGVPQISGIYDLRIPAEIDSKAIDARSFSHPQIIQTLHITYFVARWQHRLQTCEILRALIAASLAAAAAPITAQDS